MPAAEDPAKPDHHADAFIQRWKESGGHERANYQLFLAELCDLLEVPRPDPAKPENARNAYTFERSVSRAKSDGTASTVFLDLYKSGCFVLETKQGATAPSSSYSSSSSSSPRTAKYRFFISTDGYSIPESEVVAIALDSFKQLGVISSLVHITWAKAKGGWMGKGNDLRYQNSDCFETFPFPDPDEASP